jgi:hypothetical protein
MKMSRHKTIFKVMAMLALGVLIYPPILLLAGAYSLERVQWIMLTATLAWFVSAFFWLGRDHNRSEDRDHPAG